MAPPPELIEELVEEVLLRFPPHDPASLLRAALVCKLWCRLVSGTAFRRRFREFHRGAAPLLGVLYTTGHCGHKRQIRDDDSPWEDDAADTDDRCVKRARVLPEPTAHFVPTTSYRPADDARRNGWRAIDAHHGRVLLCCQSYCHLSVWDPVTDKQRDLPEVPLHTLSYSAAVTCAHAAGGGNCCDHLDCHRGPFLVVAIDVQPHIIIFSVYSSESGAWSDPTELEHPNPGSLGVMKQTPGVLVGSTLYFLVHFNNEIVEFDLATQEVATVDLPPQFRPHPRLEQRSIVLITGDDGELGFVASDTTKYQLELWSLVTDARFVQTRVIDLHKVLPSDALISNSLQVNGFANGGVSRFLFMRTSDGLYSIEVNSSHVRKLASDDQDEDDDVVPYISFCTPTSTTGDEDSAAGASPDARPTTAMIVPRRPRTKKMWATK